MIEACGCKNIIIQQCQDEATLAWNKILEERIFSKTLLFPYKKEKVSVYIYTYIYLSVFICTVLGSV